MGRVGESGYARGASEGEADAEGEGVKVVGLPLSASLDDGAVVGEDGDEGALGDEGKGKITDMLAEKTVTALKQSWDRDIIKSTCKKFDVSNIADTYEEIFNAL